jgi:hypothetical protein
MGEYLYDSKEKSWMTVLSFNRWHLCHKWRLCASFVRRLGPTWQQVLSTPSILWLGYNLRVPTGVVLGPDSIGRCYEPLRGGA